MSDQEQPPYPEGTYPPKLQAWMDDVFDWMKNNRVTPGGPGIFVDDAPGGGKRISTTPSGSASTAGHPWEVFLRKTKDGVWQRGVFHDSPLQLDADRTNTMTPSAGLLSSLDRDTATGWVTTEDGDVIWADATFNTSSWPTITTLVAKSYGNGDTYETELAYVNLGDDDSPDYCQTKFHIPIAFISTKTNGDLYVEYQYIRGVPVLFDGYYTATLADGSAPNTVICKFWTP